MNQNKGRIALFMTLVLVSAILVPIASGIETETNEETQATELSNTALISEQRGDRNRTNNFTDETGFLNGTYPWSDLPPDYRFDKPIEDNIPYDLLGSTGSWTLLNANPGWSARSEHNAVVMPVDGSIVLMGGAGQGLFNDVWRSTDNGVTWTQMVSNAPWTDRSHFTAVAMPDNSIVLMGGRDGSGYRNDVWRSTDNGTSWTQMTANAGWSARMCPTSVALSDDSIVLMGGTGSSGSSNDTWLSEDYGATWSLRSSSPGWRARYVHNSVALPGDNILLLGGYNFGYSWWNDTWLSTDKGATWSLLTMNAEWPGRFSPSTVVMPDGSIVLLGGYGGYLMNDMWQSTDNGTTWERINQTSGWSVRYSHRAVTTHDGNVVLMGGVDYSVPYRDVWRYVTAPVANFTATNTSGDSPLEVQFTDTSTGNPTSWNWSFGDGEYSEEQNPLHEYVVGQTYTVSLTAGNAIGNDTETKSDLVTVTCPYSCDVTITNHPYIEFGIYAVSCPAYDISWHPAVCVDNTLIRWAMAGKSSPFYTNLSPAMWKRSSCCQNPGYSWAVDSPANKPIYYAAVSNPDTANVKFFSHAVAAEYLGTEDVRNSTWEDWKFFNYDEQTITIGWDHQIPNGTSPTTNTTVRIDNITGIHSCVQYNPDSVRQFTIDQYNQVSPETISFYAPGYLISKTGKTQIKEQTIPNDLKIVLHSMNDNEQFSISKWDFDPKSKDLTFYAYDLSDSRAIYNLKAKTVGGYSIRIIHDTEFEKKRAVVQLQLAELRKNPDYQIAWIAIHKDTINDPPENYAELWTYKSTTENEKLDNAIINGWRIFVHPVSQPPSKNKKTQ